MKRRRPRAGIERKILTSILWVSILPMALALIFGYLSARRGQSAAVQQTLLTVAAKTADGLARESFGRLRLAKGLAADPAAAALLQSVDSGSPSPSEEAIRNFNESFGPLLSWQAVDSQDSPPVVALYTPAGKLVYGFGDPAIKTDLGPIHLDPPDEAQFTDFRSQGSERFVGSILAPVMQRTTKEVLGYLNVQIGIDSILRFTLGDTVLRRDESGRMNEYQMAVGLPNGSIINTVLGPNSGNDGPRISVALIDPTLEKHLREQHDYGSILIKDYHTAPNGPGQDVLLAYQHLNGVRFNNYNVWFIAYRPAALVFATINELALIALAGCMFAIAVLCVRAYRNVHNNIVRPLSLLNEGAQIIRQGDFDLKLKIDTGDEIEELAQSFNRMALTLNKNMQQLEASEEKHRSLVHSLRDGIYQTNNQGDLTFLNPACVAILGFDSVKQAIGRNLRDMFIDLVELDPSLTGRDLPEGDERTRVWMRRQDGRTICVELTRDRMIDDHGQVVGIEGNIRDITKSVRLEQDARERSERISAINQIANVINSSLEAGRLYESLVAELRKLVRFDYASVALMGETGLSFDGRQLWPEDAVGFGYTFTLDAKNSYAAWVARERRCLRVEDLRASREFPPEQFPDFVRSCLCVPLYATGRIIGTLNLGAKMPAAFTSAHAETLEQMAPHLAAAIRNAQLLVNLQLSLEEVSRAREKLAEANDELKTLDEMKTNLLSNVSHELRTPLVSVMGYTDMILAGKAGAINKTQQEFLEISLRNVEKLVTLIENLLDFSRLHRGDERLIFDTFDLADCARASLQVVKPLADSQGIAVTLTAPEGKVPIEGDKGKMGQVFNNLLSNALKFNSPGGRVDVRLAVGPREVEVTVSDTGIGIPKEALDKIFTRFYQYDASSTRKYGGTGIGLAIVHDIVRLHGSTISVQSEVGRGSTFRFVLSLAETAGSARPSADQETHTLVELITRDRALSTQVRHLLQAEGMDMIHATTLERAIDLLERHSPDCIMFDADAAAQDEPVLNEILAHPVAKSVPILLLTTDEALYERHRSAVAARIKGNFRKSTLLSGIHNAMNRGVRAGEPIGNKVLCIDDDPEVLTFIGRCLSAEGYEAETCLSGEEGLDRAASREFGLVLLDIAMPGMDGWDTCRRLKQNPALAGIKVYMVTAKPIDRNLELLRECGADGFVLKPFRPEDLVQLVHGLELRAAAK
jgi:PAS domain S-box-containing protein